MTYTSRQWLHESGLWKRRYKYLRVKLRMSSREAMRWTRSHIAWHQCLEKHEIDPDSLPEGL